MTRFFQKAEGLDVQTIRDQIYDLLEWDYRSKSIPPAVMPLMNACKIITSVSGAFRCNGHVIGIAHDNMGFEIREIAARQDWTQPSTSQTPIAPTPGFEGILVSLNHHARFLSRTIIVTDKGVLNRKIVNGMSRVGLVDRGFEARFEVYSDDQVEARSLLSPDFMERLMVFQDEMRAEQVECVFLGNKLHIALLTRNAFNIGGDFLSSRVKSAADTILNEINDVFLLLERVQFLHARLGRLGAAAQDKARREYYLELSQVLRKKVEAAIADGSLGKGENKHLSDTAYLVCETLHGLLGPRI